MQRQFALPSIAVCCRRSRHSKPTPSQRVALGSLAKRITPSLELGKQPQSNEPELGCFVVLCLQVSGLQAQVR